MGIDSLEHVVRSRVRMFLRHTWLVAILGSIVLGGVIWAGVYYITRATVIRIAAGPPGSVNARFEQVLAQRFAQSRDRIRLQVVATDGPKASARAFADGSADLAILPSIAGDAADWPVVAIVRKNVLALIVPAAAPAAPEKKTGSGTPKKKTKSTKTKKTKTKTKSDKTDDADATDATDDTDNTDNTSKLTKVSQLAGHRVGIVTGNEATTNLLNGVLNHYGVPLGQVQVSLIDPKNLADTIHNNQVDMIFVAGSATGQAIADAIAAASQGSQAPTFIDIDQAEGIAARDPAFSSVDIDAGTFGGNPPTPDDSLKSLSFAEYLVARRSLGRDNVAALARLIYTTRLALDASMPGEIKIAAPATDKDGAVSVHPGALAYLGDTQQDFFDKYGNEIFYGMLIFPVFGSAIAGVATYLRSDHRTRRLRLLQQVLDMVRKAHAAQTLEEIERLEVEADNLVIGIVHQSEREEFDEPVRMSFSFALDQLRFAIAARRTAILDRAGSGSAAAAA